MINKWNGFGQVIFIRGIAMWLMILLALQIMVDFASYIDVPPSDVPLFSHRDRGAADSPDRDGSDQLTEHDLYDKYNKHAMLNDIFLFYAETI